MKSHKVNKRSPEKVTPVETGRRHASVAAGLAPGGRQVYTAFRGCRHGRRIGDYLVRTGAMQKSQADESVRARRRGPADFRRKSPLPSASCPARQWTRTPASQAK